MGKGNSKATSHSDRAAKAEQVEGAAANGQINIQMVQNVLLIWLDKNIDETKKDCQNTIAQLQSVVHSVNKYTNAEECIQFLEMIDNGKVCMMISGSFGQKMMPRVHDMSQVDSIFIFCGNKQYHEEWVKKWPKIKGVFTEITLICEALRMAAQQCEQDSMSISVMGTSDSEDVSKKNLDQIEPTFMYTQILKEILLTIKFEQIHFREFIAYCLNDLAENEKQLKILTQFEQGYREKTPIWWYTRESFLYEMLNRALREMHVDMIIKLGFFINDIQRQIKQLHQEQFGVHSSSDSFKLLYRGQGMMKIKFEEMSKNKGGLISFNSFLSTSEEPKVSLQFAKNALKQPEMIGIFFVMKIDPTQSTTPFASITEVSFFKGKEKEVLFSMHTVFRIGEITSMDGNNRLFQVELILTSDNDKDLCKLTDYIQKNTYWSEEGWYRLGSVLLKMGQFEQAQQVYEILLGQTTSESEKGRFYHQLGLAKNDRGEYKEALVLYENALAIYNRTLSPKDLNLAKCYNNIGLVHYNMDDYAKALLSHEKSLEVKQQSLPADHADLGVSYNNIGNVYFKMGDYSKALLYHEKALEIKKQSLLPNHPSLGSSYNNIGLVHENMDDYSKARSYYERAVDIGKQSLPPDHPHLKQWRDNLDKIKQKL